jgi:hypothetical protein
MKASLIKQGMPIPERQCFGLEFTNRLLQSIKFAMEITRVDFTWTDHFVLRLQGRFQFTDFLIQLFNFTHNVDFDRF